MFGTKAFVVNDKYCEGNYFVVYAETRGKAITTAMNHTEGAFDDYVFTEICARRAPKLDKFYSGHYVLKWCNEEDRLIAVREAGFFCSYEMDLTLEECEQCNAHEWCSRYEEMKEG